MSSKGTIATHFGDLVDERNNQGKRHFLLDVITIAICAIIAGGEGWTDMELFGQTKEAWFRSFLPLPHGIPSDDTFRRVFERIAPGKFQQSFVNWVKVVEQLTDGQVIAIDGKTVKGTRRSNKLSLRAKRLKASWDETYLRKILVGRE